MTGAGLDGAAVAAGVAGGTGVGGDFGGDVDVDVARGAGAADSVWRGRTVRGVDDEGALETDPPVGTTGLAEVA